MRAAWRAIPKCSIEPIKYFRAGSTVRFAAELTGVNRNAAVLFFRKLRETIHDKIVSREPAMMSGEIEVNESYFGGGRKGKRGCGQGSRLRAPEKEWP